VTKRSHLSRSALVDFRHLSKLVISDLLGKALQQSLQVAVRNIARALGDEIGEEKPLLDSRLPDGSRQRRDQLQDGIVFWEWKALAEYGTDPNSKHQAQIGSAIDDVTDHFDTSSVMASRP
jgi:hypothetical protein